MAAGMLIARNRWAPYAQLDWLHDRYLLDQPQFGSTPADLFETDPRSLIGFRTPADVAARRAEVIRFLWGERGLPGGSPDVLVSGFRDHRFDGLPNLARVDRLTTRLEYGLESHAFVYVPLKANGAAVIYQHGHTGADERDKARIGRLLERGYAVAELFMLLYPPNNRPRVQVPRVGWFHLTEHQHLALLSPRRGHPIGYFLEPVVRVTNYLAPRYDRIAAMGYSGGGWTSMMAGAIDPRIRSSFIVASVYPLYLHSGSARLDHFEGYHPSLYRLATHLELMVMAGSGPGRQAVQILNRYDPCCFAGTRAETYAPTVRRAVRELGPGEFRAFVDSSERAHGISERAMDLILRRLEKMGPSGAS